MPARTSFLSDILSSLFDRRPSAFTVRDTRPTPELLDALLSGQGEASGTRAAAAILDRYETLDKAGKTAFFERLNEEHDIDAEAVAAAALGYAKDKTPEQLAALLAVSEPPRQEILRRLNRPAGATERLVRMRADLLGLLRDHPALKRADLDFRHLFASWFNRGFLVMRRIDWHTPAHILEKIVAYEAVHAISDWNDLRERLQPEDRRCFAFFHPAMPDEPLIFVEVALTRAIPTSIDALLSDKRERLAEKDVTTAVFYSISNCQAGLAGVSFGNFLIKQVATELGGSLPNLKTFVTLSPVPGFVRWLKAVIAPDAATPHPRAADIRRLLEKGRDTASEADMALVEGLGAEYLVNAKRDDGQPVDAVARFHLGNGARLERLNPSADMSPKAMAESLGLMVNYLYDLNAVEANHEAFASAGEVVTTRQIRALSAQQPNSKTRRT